MKKKTIVSLAAGAVIASSYASTVDAAATHRVQSGDSLWRIAQKYNTTVDALKSFNNLDNTIIFPDQLLQVDPDPAPKKPAVKGEQITKPSSPSSPSTYTVVAGDSLSKIAHQHNISLQHLMEWNNLTTTLIRPGDVFTLVKPGAASKQEPKQVPEKAEPKQAPQKTEPAPSPAPAPAAPSKKQDSYTVQPGDYLGKISRKFNVSIGDLKKWNNLQSDTIFAGQSLKLSTGESTSPPVKAVPVSKRVDNQTEYNVAILISEAKKFLGHDYVWGGSTPSGFDCSGYIYYLYNKAGKKISRVASDGYFSRSYYVNNPQPGDLVFFSNTYRPGISHLGIYIGNNEFIHAASSGIQITNLEKSNYWKSKFDSFKRLY